MNMEDIDWLNQCKQDPGRYRIDVDNDCLSVTDLREDDCVRAGCAE